jgi:hypothetical protein
MLSDVEFATNSESEMHQTYQTRTNFMSIYPSLSFTEGKRGNFGRLFEKHMKHIKTHETH